MYGKCKEIRRACAVFEQMDQKTISSWSALIAAHATMGMWYECLGLFGAMSKEGCWRTEESILVTVLSACTHLGALDLGRCAHGSLLRNMSGLNVMRLPWQTCERTNIPTFLACLLDPNSLLVNRRLPNHSNTVELELSHAIGLNHYAFPKSFT
ncbi:hypothetical protein RJ639_019467 [Escallonia herrerae]|uniref:Pentatricopeptide repeat-containing protein n=1 Tax=Escallonia herrerae TaxID=1293975 RepID=A0AA88V7L5_9ASTE|nr:hypothetical protein RJ639_019467 [Escallonia herrerae]